ncbi:lyase family protein [Nocardioides sp. CFH 31398]|uniref:lyase family protein n=1 Tax=Nocardioides sp. CFH 31398 TaxID=2919579 RepID=UPI001F050ADD|nr:lyase family protein [Nocardioides sp. CFH 31398]MCH1867906.1 3-carboxy-cis,cis-muconate cycloisomerase [Nocardioides sp. CFH 31398]
MSGLLWPGDHRADGLADDAAVLRGMVAVEDAWLAALVAHGVAPAEAAADLRGLVTPEDLPALAAGAESGGTPVLGLVALLRERTGGVTADWLHRGLTSQDVVDTGLLLAVRDALGEVVLAQRDQLTLLRDLARTHRDTPAVARTLTQHAVPTTFGLKVAGWASGVLGAATGVAAVGTSLPAQLGGAGGTMAAAVELTGSPSAALDLLVDVAGRLGLVAARPWHTTRAPVAAVGDALVTATDAWGHLAADVLVLTRSEVREVSEAGAGGSSTMPHKQNPVLAVLLRRAALAAPALGSTLHLASATAVDERSDGAWHAEWETLLLLARRTVVAARQATDLLAGLRVDADRMAATLAAADGVRSEQESMARLAGHAPEGAYLGAAGALVEAALAEVDAFLEPHHETPDPAPDDRGEPA